MSQNELDAILLNWGQRNPFSSAVSGDAAVIPEPNTLGLASLLLLVVLALKNKKR